MYNPKVGVAWLFTKFSCTITTFLTWTSFDVVFQLFKRRVCQAFNTINFEIYEIHSIEYVMF